MPLRIVVTTPGGTELFELGPVREQGLCCRALGCEAEASRRYVTLLGLAPFGLCAEHGEQFERYLASVSGAALISAERARQVSAEGWTPGHDDEHEAGELARAAISYALHPFSDERLGDDHRAPAGTVVPAFWPWDPQWWKPTPKDRVRELVKAGALIAAEIDRLLRATEGEQ